MSIVESGFLKLDLECSYETKGDKNIVSKTVLGSTSRKPIVLTHGSLLIVEQSLSDSVM